MKKFSQKQIKALKWQIISFSMEGPPASPEPWDCPNCGTIVRGKNTCPKCGYSK